MRRILQAKTWWCGYDKDEGCYLGEQGSLPLLVVFPPQKASQLEEAKSVFLDHMVVHGSVVRVMGWLTTIRLLLLVRSRCDD